MNQVLDQYLLYLHESDEVLQEKGAIGRVARKLRPRPIKFTKNVAKATRADLLTKKGLKSNIKWIVLIIPALQGAWRLINMAYRKETRKCGLLTTGLGRQVCITKARLGAEREKLRILQKSAVEGRRKALDPTEYSRLIGDKILIQKSRIRHHELKLQQLLGKQEAKAAIKQVKTESEVLTDAFVAGLFGAIIAGIIVDAVLWRSWRTASALVSSASRRCGTFKKGPERAICMSKIRLQGYEEKLRIINKVRPEEQKNPDKARKKIKEAQDKLGPKIQILKDNIAANQNLLRQQRNVGE